MDTPIQLINPNKRRKLIKILKKKNVGLQMQTSVSQVYKKKLKSAINVSLNSTRNVRTLQANNKSLASSLEKQKQNTRIISDAYQDLQKVNHVLRTKLIEMERIGYLSTSSLETEVERRVELKMQSIMEKLNGLSTCSKAVMDMVQDLTNICSSKPAMDNSLLNSTLTSLSVIPAPSLSLDDTDIESHEDTFKETEVDPVGFKKKSSWHEMSLIMEQSLLQPPERAVPEGSLNLLTESSSTVIKKQYSRLPQRIPKQDNDTRRQNENIDVSHVTSPSAEPNIHRSTFTVVHVWPEDDTLLETLAPPFLLSDESLSESIPNEIQGIGNLPAVQSRSPDTDQEVVLENPLAEKISCQSQHENTLPTKKSNKQPNVKVKKPISKPVKSLVKKENSFKITPGLIKKDPPLIFNEFALNAAHLERMKKVESRQQNLQTDGSQTNGPVAGEKTIHMVEDMELTMPLEKDFPNSTISENTYKIIPVDKEVSKQENEAQIEAVDGALTVPDAVTMRISKPGQFVFAASRKESDGTRKALPVVTKSRSRTKKITAKMMEKMQHDEPQCIFDFHEKTPTSLSNSKKIVDNSTTEGMPTPSPPHALGNHREKMLNFEEMDAQTNENVSSNQLPSLLGNGAEYQLPLKDSPDKRSAFNLSTRSRSRSRKLKHRSDEEFEANTLHQFQSVVDSCADQEIPLSGNSAQNAISSRSRGRPKSRSKKLKTDTYVISKHNAPLQTGDEALFTQPHESTCKSTGSPTKQTRSQSCDRRLKNKSDNNTNVNSGNHLSSLYGDAQVEDQPPSLLNRRRSIPQSRNLKPHSDTETNNKKPSSVLGDGAEYELPLKDSPYSSNTIKTRTRSKSRGKQLKLDSDDEANINPKQKTSLLGNGAEYELPLKDSPLNKNTILSTRKRSKSRSRKLKQDGDVEAEVDSKQKGQASIGNGNEYELPLKGSPCNSYTTFRTTRRSKSRSRKLKPDSDEETEVSAPKESQAKLIDTNEYEVPLKTSPSRSASTLKSHVSRSRNRGVEIAASSGHPSPSAHSKTVNKQPLEQNSSKMGVNGEIQNSCVEILESDDKTRSKSPCFKTLSAQRKLSESSVCHLKTNGSNQHLHDGGEKYRVFSIDNELFKSLEDPISNINRPTSPEQLIKSPISNTKKLPNAMKNINTKTNDHKLKPVQNVNDEPIKIDPMVKHLTYKAKSLKTFESAHAETETSFSEPKQAAKWELKDENPAQPNFTKPKDNRKISPKPKNYKFLDKQGESANKVDSFSSASLEPTRNMLVSNNAVKVNQTQALKDLKTPQSKGEKMQKSPTTDVAINNTTNKDENKEKERNLDKMKQKDNYTSNSYTNTYAVQEENLSLAYSHDYMRKKNAKDSKSKDCFQNKCASDKQHHVKTENSNLPLDEFQRKPSQQNKTHTLTGDDVQNNTDKSRHQEMENMGKFIEEPFSSKAKSAKKIFKNQEKMLASNKDSENDQKPHLSPSKRLHQEQDMSSSPSKPDTKRRRAASKVNYAELKLNKKLRRGDPFTSHYCTTDKLDIYKHKGNKKRSSDRNVLGSLHNQSIKEDE